jgi:zinc D-Ala-D-Ala dipeptidase
MTVLKFEHIPITDNNEPLVSLYDYPFQVESVYYTQGFAPDSTMKIRLGVAEKLRTIQNSFDSTYQFKILDGYRPRAVQDAIYNDFWKQKKQTFPDFTDKQLNHEVEKYVTRATLQDRIPPHATGGAIDLTLVDADGKELDMGTVFDHFGSEAAPLYYEEHTELDETVRSNRRILRTAMWDAGFTSDVDEWWHFDYGNQVWAVNASKNEAIYGEA